MYVFVQAIKELQIGQYGYVRGYDYRGKEKTINFLSFTQYYLSLQ